MTISGGKYIKEESEGDAECRKAVWKDTHPVPRKCHPSVRPLVLSRHVWLFQKMGCSKRATGSLGVVWLVLADKASSSRFERDFS